MADPQLLLLSQAFLRLAASTDELAHSLSGSGNPRDAERLQAASQTYRQAAIAVQAAAAELGDAAFATIPTLSDQLEMHAARIGPSTKDVASAVDLSIRADDFARAVSAGNRPSALRALTSMANLLAEGTSDRSYEVKEFLAEAPRRLPAFDFGIDGDSEGDGGGGNDSGATSDSVRTYAHIEIASSMRVGEEQSLTVGIDPEQQANVVGEAMTIAGGYPFDVTVTAVAQEFVLRSAETWSNTLHATAAAPNPSVTLHVTPTSETPLTEAQSRTIAVLYSMDAHTLGYGAVHVDVHPPETPLQPAETTTARAVMTSFPDHAAFDLTIRINDFGDGSGRLNWTFESPHFAIPPEPVTATIGSVPGDFAAGLIRDVNTASSPKMAALRINGNAQIIARAMPKLFASVWKQLHDAIPQQIPTVLIISEDAYVPWELAAVNELFDTSAPSLLGAQADVGRWIFSDRGDIPLPPPDTLDFEPMVEVTAVYTSAKSPRLEHAEEEGKELARLYGAQHVDATDVAITDCFHGAQPPATTIHVALHGIYDQNSPVFGLIMVDNAVLTPSAIQGGTAKRTPFVFLNACQVGTGKEVLGQYAGMPAAFVYAKARGVVAPLWSVDDGAAKDIALRFYDGLNNGQRPAALLRAERKRAADPANPAPTSLAYLYYGNPLSKSNAPPIPAPAGS
jgi:hypothetical protein